jgi:outer membrane protein assembly factor BamA
VRIFATAAAGILGLVLAVWGVVQLVPRDVQADEPIAARTDVVRSIRYRGDLEPIGAHDALRTRVGRPVDAQALAADREQLEANLIGEGHLDARVSATGTVDVVFAVDAGPRYRMGAVRLAGPLAARYPALADELTIAAGDDVSTRAIDRTQERLGTWLAVHGVARVELSHTLDIDRAAKRVDVTYEVAQRRAVARR